VATRPLVRDGVSADDMAKSSSAMFPSLPQPRHMPCPDCGESVAADVRDEHVCDDERWLTYQLFQLRDEIASLEQQVASYLGSPRGRFELWDAERRRLG
jgi:hypothetical protein